MLIKWMLMIMVVVEMFVFVISADNIFSVSFNFYNTFNCGDNIYICLIYVIIDICFVCTSSVLYSWKNHFKDTSQQFLQGHFVIVVI